MSDSVSQPVHYYKSPLGASLAPLCCGIVWSKNLVVTTVTTAGTHAR